MKYLIYILFAFFSIKAFAQDSNVSNYKGRVGKYLIEVELSKNGNSISGSYRYTNKSTYDLKLEGILKGDSVKLSEYNSDGKLTGYFNGLIGDKKTILGLWMSADGSREYQFSFLPADNSPLTSNKSPLEAISGDNKPIIVVSGDSDSELILWGIGVLLIILIVIVIIIVKQKKKSNIVYVTKDGKVTDEDKLNVEKGFAFERYIVSLIMKNPDYFKILNATSDKEFDGVFVESNTNPDFLVQFRNEKKNIKDRFAVECKYRSKTTNGRVTVIKSIEQYDNYQSYGERKNLNVFIALGVGGSPNKPFQLFIIPLNRITIGSISLFDYAEFETKRDYLFYLPDSGTLK